MISILLPTFNRVESLKLQVQNILDSSVLDNFSLTIVNDGSNDGTQEYLDSISDKSNIRIIHNDKNLGYSKTLIKCLSLCSTEYMLWLTDDDNFHFHQFNLLKQFVNLNKADFVSCEFHSNVIYRMNHRNAEIGFKGIWNAARHAPGLLFKKSSFIGFEKDILDGVDENDSVAFFYPQIYLLFLAKAAGKKLMTSSIVIGSNRSKLISTNAKDQNGNSYLSFHNSVKRFDDFKKFYNRFYASTCSKEILEIIKRHDFSLASYIRRGIINDYKDLEEDFLKSLIAAGISKKSIKYLPSVIRILFKKISRRIQ